MVKGVEEIVLTETALRQKASHMVAIDGVNWEQIRAREGEAKAARLLEEAIEAEKESIASQPGVDIFKDNSEPGYGVNYDNLSCFRSKGQASFDQNYLLLRQIWYGINYVEVPGRKSGVPHEFLSAMNTSEILSLYRAFARLLEKRNIPTGKGEETISKEELKGMPVELVISKMVGYGCRHQAMAAMTKRGWTYFHTRRGDLIRRIKPFGQRTKDKFMELLDNSVRTTQLTSGRGGQYDFEDPCYDGWDARRGLMKIKGPMGRKSYTRAIASFMGNLYARNTQKA